jgi:hypothetical protein
VPWLAAVGVQLLEPLRALCDDDNETPLRNAAARVREAYLAWQRAVDQQAELCSAARGSLTALDAAAAAAAGTDVAAATAAAEALLNSLKRLKGNNGAAAGRLLGLSALLLLLAAVLAWFMPDIMRHAMAFARLPAAPICELPAPSDGGLLRLALDLGRRLLPAPGAATTAGGKVRPASAAPAASTASAAVGLVARLTRVGRTLYRQE